MFYNLAMYNMFLGHTTSDETICFLVCTACIGLFIKKCLKSLKNYDNWNKLTLPGSKTIVPLMYFSFKKGHRCSIHYFIVNL